MASPRQAINIGFPSPIYVNESGTRDTILPGLYLNDTAGISSQQAIVLQEAPDPRLSHPAPFVLPGVQGPNVETPAQLDRAVTVQELPGHPLPVTWSGDQRHPNVAAPPQIQQWVVGQEQPAHPLPFTAAGAQGAAGPTGSGSASTPALLAAGAGLAISWTLGGSGFGGGRPWPVTGSGRAKLPWLRVASAGSAAAPPPRPTTVLLPLPCAAATARVERPPLRSGVAAARVPAFATGAVGRRGNRLHGAMRLRLAMTAALDHGPPEDEIAILLLAA